MKSLILESAARALLPLFLIFSIFVLLRGHNDPGGGFVGGLVAASAFALYALAFGVDSARKILTFSPHLLMAAGLLIAAVSGLVGLYFGDAFLHGLWLEQKVPVIGSFGTPFVFDIGVYMVVVGVVLTIVFTLFEDASTNQ